MAQFNMLANGTIRKHNSHIYQSFISFLQPEKATDYIQGGVEHGLTGLQIRGVTNLRN